MVLGNQRFDRRFAERPEARVRVRLVGGHEPAVPDDIGVESHQLSEFLVPFFHGPSTWSWADQTHMPS